MNCDPKALLAAAKCYQCVPKAVWGSTVISLLCEWANSMACTFQEGAGSPVGVNIPAFIGQLYHDTTNNIYYRSTGLTNADWVFIGGPGRVVWAPVTEIATWNDSGGAGQTGDYATFLATADLNTLSSLNLSGTAITSLLVNYCPVLSLLSCSYCTGPLTSLDVTGCRSLTNVQCNNNSLTTLDFTSCTDLSVANCTFNSLTAINVTGLSNLTDLDLTINNLNSLDVSTCPALVFLTTDYNPILHLNLSGLANLTNVTCIYNTMLTLNVTGCTALQTLSCRNNSLSSLDVSGLNALATLFCYYNTITSLNVTGCTSLITLTCSYNSMNSGSVDLVLCELDVNGAINGNVDITVNSPPGAPGLVCDGNLVGKGWTVIHD